MNLNLPTLAEDKGNHWAYGSLIAAFTETVLVLGVWIAVVLLDLSLPVWPVALAAGLVAIAVTAALAKLKEWNDQRLNDEALLFGLRPPHGVEFADIRATVWGGMAVAVPTLIGSMVLWLAGV